MTLQIQMDKVAAVLLADGWQHVTFTEEGTSTFMLDNYRFLHGDIQLGAGGGYASWQSGGERVVCPLASILAFKIV